MTAKALLGVVLAAALACGGSGKSASPSGSGIADREWELVALGDRKEPRGAGGKPITLKLDSEAKRAAGFGGCNRYTGSFEQSGETLAFGALASTKMACQEGMDVEDAYLPALGSVRSWQLEDGVLVLKAAGVAILRFRAAAP